MSNAWKSYRGAPDPGAPLCAADTVPDGETHCLEHEGFPILLLRFGGVVHAYVNACPHQYLPLNHKGNHLISADGKILRCTNHGAGFAADTGKGVEGLGIGECLDAIPVDIVDGTIVIASAG